MKITLLVLFFTLIQVPAICQTDSLRSFFFEEIKVRSEGDIYGRELNDFLCNDSLNITWILALKNQQNKDGKIYIEIDCDCDGLPSKVCGFTIEYFSSYLAPWDKFYKTLRKKEILSLQTLYSGEKVKVIQLQFITVEKPNGSWKYYHFYPVVSWQYVINDLFVRE